MKEYRRMNLRTNHRALLLSRNSYKDLRFSMERQALQLVQRVTSN